MLVVWRVNDRLDAFIAIGISRFRRIEACLFFDLVLVLNRDARVNICTYLDEVLALWLGNQRLKLGCGKGIDETSLRDNE